MTAAVYDPVLTKDDFVRRYQLGEFGNASLTWNSFDDFLRSAQANETDRFHLRNRIAGGATYYNLEWDKLIHLWATVDNPENWYCSAMAPHDLTVIQGEVIQSHNRAGLELIYSTVKKPMREALAEESKVAHGVFAASMLRVNLCPNSHEWLMELLDRYPHHAVEFSTFSKPWGTLWPIYNTVFWEVRLY